MDRQNFNELVFTVPARVSVTGASRSAELVSLVQEKHVLDASILKERSLFFWDAEISSDVIDAYYTHMLPSTLSNFRDDAIAGVAYLPGHKHYELPFGRSVDAVLEDATNPLRKRVVSSFYTMPGLKLNATSTDDLINGLRSGILRDVSVGFSGGQMLCDICQRDFWDCPHIPGLKYEDKEGDTVRKVLATFGIDGAHLSEVSSVFDGATPRAEVLKAHQMAEDGELEPDAIRILEARYRMRLPETRIFAGVDLQQSNNTNAPVRGETMDFEKVVTDIRGALGIGKDADVLSAVTGMAEQAQRLRSVEEDRDAVAGKLEAETTRSSELDAQIAELTPLAADGRTYRADLIAEAIAEGVRARGEDFDTETYQSVLESASIAVVKRMKADWQAIGDSQFVGGRKSADEGEQAPVKKSERKPVIAKSAYKV